MTALEAVVLLPWSELLPMPTTPLATTLGLALGFWYGYQHPEGS